MATMGTPGTPGRVWTDITGSGITTKAGTWQNRGDQEVELYFSTSASPPSEGTKGLLLAPGTGYIDKNGSTYVYGRAASANSSPVFVAD